MTAEQLAELRAEVIRQRAFVRAAETQGSKILGLIDAAAVVTAPEPALPPAPSTPIPDLHERWDYGTVEAMLANPNGWLQRADIRFGRLSLRPGQLVCTFLARDPLDGQGESMCGHKIVFPAAFGRPRELWLETEITLPPTWTTAFLGQDKQPDHKTISYDTDTGSGRLETKFGWGDLVKIQIEGVLQERTQVGTPIDIPVARIPHTIGAPVSYRRYCTGLPIRLRAHLKVSAPATRDGAFEVWLEGEKVFQQVGIDTGSTNTTGGLTGVTFGRNLNQIPTREQWFAIGPVKIWKQNPGGFA